MNEILYADEFTEEEREKLAAFNIKLDPSPTTYHLKNDPREIEDREERLGRLDPEEQEHFHDLEVELSNLIHTDPPDEKRIASVVVEMKNHLS